MLATLDPSANQLYRSLECQLGIAFNDRSFDKASCTGDTLMSPFSTIRANPVSSSPEGAEEDDKK